MDQTEQITNSEEAFRALKRAYELLIQEEKSRELSLTITKLEEAMMWLNKDRTRKGELQSCDTHYGCELEALPAKP